jgi:colanic acid biosynthesis glycosyl transferase WcaI
MTVRPLNILILGQNYSPELIGIGPCTSGMAQALAAKGNHVRVICGQPSYPSWQVAEGYRGRRPKRSLEAGVTVLRLPHYVPADPRGVYRILHHISFAALAFCALAISMVHRRPDVMIAVVPSLFSAFVARLFAGLAGVPLWLHVQDFELDMALATGQMRAANRPTVRRIERAGLRSGRVSSISPQMCARLVERGNDPARVVEFRNWANPDVRPLTAPSPFRAEWNIERPFVALYSGNIAAKQGIEIVVQAARLLERRQDLLFVVAGNGANRAALVAAAAGCGNILFADLQPPERLCDLLGLATVHLLPQIADAADLVLPSKLPNMLASGAPVVATAMAGTSLAEEVQGCGIVTQPHDALAFAAAIERLLDDPALRQTLGQAALECAASRWNKDVILGRFEGELRSFQAERKRQRLGSGGIARGIAIEPLAE